MTHRPSDKPSIVTVPFRQTVSKAGEIGSVTEDTSTWLPLENGLNIKDGKLALSTSTSTVVTNAQTLYPQLWANTPAAWKSGSDLVVPPHGGGIYTGWMNILSLMDQASGYPLNTGISDANQSYSYYYARVNGDSLDLRFRWNGVTAGSGTSSVVWPYPDLSTLGLPSSFTGLAGDVSGIAQTYKIGHLIGNQFVSAPIAASISGMTLSDMATAGNIRGGDIETSSQVRASISIPMQVFGDITPIIYLFDNVASNAIGLPDATAESKGLTTLNQVAEAGRNYIINGGFDFWQRGTIFNLTGSSNYTSDRWIIWTANKTAGTVDVELSSDVPSNSSVKNSIKFINSSAVFSGTGSFGISQRIEAANFSNYAGQELIASFWIKSSVTGTISTNIRLSDNQNIAYPVTINQANTWEKKVIKITNTVYSNPKSTDLAAIKFTIGFYSGFSLANDGVWEVFAADVVASNSQSFNYENAIINITEIKLEEGSQATKFTRAGGTYAGEERLCHRYYYTPDDARPVVFSSIATAASQRLYTSVDFPVRMRANPTVVRTPQSENNCTFSSISFARETGFYFDYLSDGAGVCSVFTDYAADAEL